MDKASQEAPLQVMGRAAAGLRLANLPEEVLLRARQRVLDTLGCLVAGYHAGISDTVREYVRAQGGRPEVTLLPHGDKTTASLAALAHATYIFGLELSDAAPRGTVHPGCEIVSAALAIAERDGLGGERILPAVVAGYEVEIRFGRALHPHAFYQGWSTIGLLGYMMAPYVDRNPSQKPEDRKFAISLFTVQFMFWAVLVIIGSFFRGPGQNFVFPWVEGIFFDL